jgi:hypothetical protein
MPQNYGKLKRSFKLEGHKQPRVFQGQNDIVSSPCIVAGHVAGMERKARHKICRLVSRNEGKYSQKEEVVGRIILNGLLKKGCERADLICLAPTRGQWRAAMGEALYLWLSQKETNFLKTGATVSFSRTALRGVYRLAGSSQHVTR